jgi:2-C-methyl-D-erythritol 4-phosphate cytidylyltransferase/2-C-methyl-D-erythritol 2,4-cyclodiphosphate synthase
MSFSAIIVAAGSGERAGADGPKQWRLLAGRPVARWSLEALLGAGAREVAVVVREGDQIVASEAFEGLSGWFAVTGGAARAESVRNGLAALSPTTQKVLIHDAARPLLTRPVVDALVAALETADAAAPALAVSDTLKRKVGGRVETAPRDGLWRVQTPQAFRFEALNRAYAAWDGPEPPTDELAVVERAGGAVMLTPGDPMLMKLTYPEDFPMAERLAGAARVTRIGQGFDAHRFGPGEAVHLCGVTIPHDQGLIGHSDADAGLHALTDALLGAIGEGDIGDHFPPTDPQWRGAPSDIFLAHALKLVQGKGGQVVNVDLTLICERPKIKPHRAAMRARVAEILQIPVERVAVKATTTEEMGFTGRREGLAAQAVASVETPV